MRTTEQDWRVTRNRVRDSIKCGIALRDRMAEEVYYGLNLVDVLTDLHLSNPRLFADIQTVLNDASKRRFA